MLKVGVFVDVSDLYFVVKKKFDGAKLDYLKFLQQCTGSQSLVHAFAYGSQDDTTFINCLKNFGYTTKFNSKKDSWDVEITVDVVRFLSRLDVVVLGLTNCAFTPLLRYCQSHGVKVNVWGAQISKELKDAADAYHEIGDTLLHTETSEIPIAGGLPANVTGHPVEHSSRPSSKRIAT
jgi:uncharacterized LabA/DUF88 family protein